MSTQKTFNPFERFFLFCAGSDLNLLRECRRAEQIKHMGFGSLVLIPAILALVSMTYALSTLDGLEGKIWLSLLGGLTWALIIFAFDRFIVSSHRRKPSDLAELKRPVFYLRFVFALLLGIVISHPLVMLYFQGSIADQMNKNLADERKMIQEEFQQKIAPFEIRIAHMDSLLYEKTEQRNRQARIVAAEIDGEMISNSTGESETTGLRGKGPSANQKIRQLAQLQSELKALKQQQSRDKKDIKKRQRRLESQRDSSILAFTLSTDYLHQERALEQLKEGNPVVSTTQWLIISLFVLIDLLPLIFKTFSTYGVYDKVLSDEEVKLKELEVNPDQDFLSQKLNQLSRY